MKKLIAFCGVLLLAGCIRVHPKHGIDHTYNTFQPGIEVPVRNNTTACLDVEATDGQHLVLRPGQREVIRTNRDIGREELGIDVAARTCSSNILLGSTSRKFNMPRGRTKIFQTWVISSVRRVRELRPGR